MSQVEAIENVAKCFNNLLRAIDAVQSGFPKLKAWKVKALDEMCFILPVEIQGAVDEYRMEE